MILANMKSGLAFVPGCQWAHVACTLAHKYKDLRPENLVRSVLNPLLYIWTWLSSYAIHLTYYLTTVPHDVEALFKSPQVQAQSGATLVRSPPQHLLETNHEHREYETVIPRIFFHEVSLNYLKARLWPDWYLCAAHLVT